MFLPSFGNSTPSSLFTNGCRYGELQYENSVNARVLILEDRERCSTEISFSAIRDYISNSVMWRANILYKIPIMHIYIVSRMVIVFSLRSDPLKSIWKVYLKTYYIAYGKKYDKKIFLVMILFKIFHNLRISNRASEHEIGCKMVPFYLFEKEICRIYSKNA